MQRLMIRALQGTATESDLRVLNAWRCSSSANEAEWRRLVRLWELTSSEDADPSRSRRPTAAEIIARAARGEPLDE